MRTAFIETLCEAAAADSRVMLVVGDLGYSVVEEFARRFPSQYLNAGVAEQNMTGVAAGLALSGRVVFTYSIANFPTLRCLEQLRNDVCYHNANVRVVAVGGGFAYGSLGVSHHAIEDLAMMRVLPAMTVIAPGDPYEARAATRALVAHQGPAYLRLGKTGEPLVHVHGGVFEIGRAIEIRRGDDLALIVTGGLLAATVEVADTLSRKYGFEARVLSMHSIKPLDVQAVLSAARTGTVFTVEEHSVVGGLGSAVAEVLAESGSSARFKRLGVPSAFDRTVGTQAYLRDRHGLSVAKILTSVETVLTDAAVRPAD